MSMDHGRVLGEPWRDYNNKNGIKSFIFFLQHVSEEQTVLESKVSHFRVLRVMNAQVFDCTFKIPELSANTFLSVSLLSSSSGSSPPSDPPLRSALKSSTKESKAENLKRKISQSSVTAYTSFLNTLFGQVRQVTTEVSQEYSLYSIICGEEEFSFEAKGL